MRHIVLAVIAFTSGCASIGTPHDPLCAEIVRFANATEAGTQRRIELCTDWGNRCADASDPASSGVIASASCMHGGYEPGKPLCEYLTEHTSREFPSNNFSRTLACLTSRPPETYGDFEWEHAALRRSQMPDLNEGVSVDVEFARGSEQGAAMLRIDAKAELPSFPYDVVRARLEKDVGNHSPVVTGVGDCSAARTLPLLNHAAFGVTYPGGAFVVCNAKVSGNRAAARVLHYLFNASRKTVLAANFIDVNLAKRGSTWRVAEWRKTAIDYAP